MEDELFLFSEWLDSQRFMVTEPGDDRSHEDLVAAFRDGAEYDNPGAYAEWLEEKGLLQSNPKGYLPSTEELANQFEAFRRFS